MSGMLMARMMSAMLPEEKLVQDAIEELTKYKEAKFGNSTEPKDASFEGLKDFFESNPHQKLNSDVEEPMAVITTLIIKWNDKDKSMEEIMSETVSFEKELEKTDLIKPKEA